MESDQRDLGVVFDETGQHPFGQKGVGCDQKQRHGAGEKVVDEMGKAGPLRLYRASDGGDDGRHRRGHIHPHHEHRRLLEGHEARVECRQRRGDSRTGRLGDEGEEHTQKKEPQAVEPRIGGKVGERDEMAKPLHPLLHQTDPHENEPEARYGVSHAPHATSAQQLRQRSHKDQGHRQGGDFELETEKRDDPAGHRRADVGTEDDPEGLGKLHEPRRHESHGSHGGGAGRLQYRRPHRTGRRAAEGAFGKTHQPPVDRPAGQRLEAVGHDDHAQQKNSQPSGRFHQRR